MKPSALLLLALAALVSSHASAAETLVANVAEFDAAVKNAKPGDAIVLADGEWRDTELVFRGVGEAAANRGITLRAETPGKAILSGTSRLRIGGRFLTVEGLHWKNTAADDATIAFRIDSKTLAEDCTVRECAIIGDTVGEEKVERKWVSIYGRRNRVERCRFDGKQSAGTLLVVWIEGDVPAYDPNKSSDKTPLHRIAHNFFGPREKLGKNGGETIRIGDSKTSLLGCSTLVDHNYFYRCDGEAEIVSNKSCGNTYCRNVFIGCSGALTLRHGTACVVIGNCFNGDGRKGTGGVRVVGENHHVAGNSFRNLTGDEVRAALSIMNGIPDSPLNGYAQVRRLHVSGNEFIDCKQNVLVGFSDKDRKNQTLAPDNIVFKGNLVAATRAPVFKTITLPTAFSSDTNSFSGELGLPTREGWTEEDRIRLEQRMVRADSAQMARDLHRTGPAWLRPTDEYLPHAVTK